MGRGHVARFTQQQPEMAAQGKSVAVPARRGSRLTSQPSDATGDPRVHPHVSAHQRRRRCSPSSSRRRSSTISNADGASAFTPFPCPDARPRPRDPATLLSCRDGGRRGALVASHVVVAQRRTADRSADPPLRRRSIPFVLDRLDSSIDVRAAVMTRHDRATAIRRAESRSRLVARELTSARDHLVGNVPTSARDASCPAAVDSRSCRVGVDDVRGAPGVMHHATRNVAEDEP